MAPLPSPQELDRMMAAEGWQPSNDSGMTTVRIGGPNRSLPSPQELDQMMAAENQQTQQPQSTWGTIKNASASDWGNALGKSVGGASTIALDGLTLGAGDEMIAGGNALIDRVQYGTPLSQAYDQRLQQTRGIEKEVRGAAPVTSTAVDILASLKNPMTASQKVSGLVDLIKQGGKLGATTGFLEGEGGFSNRAQGGLQGGLLGAGTAGAIGAAGKGLQYGADYAKQAGIKLDRASLGLGKTDFTRSGTKRGIEDPLGDQVTKLEKAIEGARAEGTLSGPRTPDNLLKNNAIGMEKLYGEIEPIVKQAEAARAASGAKVYPKYKIAENYIENHVNAAGKAKYREALDYFKQAHRAELDGSLPALLKEKENLYSVVYDPYDIAKQNLQKYVAADVKNTTESVVSAALGSKTGKNFSNLNKRVGNLETLDPYFVRGVSGDKTGDVVQGGIQGLRTSGGVGSALNASAMIGNPLPAMGGVGLLAANTQRGKGILAKAFLGASPTMSKLAKALSGNEAKLSQFVGEMPARSNEGYNQRMLEQANFEKSLNDSRTKLSPQISQSIPKLPQVSELGKTEGKKQWSLEDRIMATEELGQKGTPEQQAKLELRMIELMNYEGLTARQAKEKIALEMPDSELAPVIGIKRPVTYDDSSIQANIPKDQRLSLIDQALPGVNDGMKKLVSAVISTESNWKANAQSSAGAKGLMQLMPANIKKFGVSDPHDPLSNIKGGVTLLAEELNRYKDPRLALAAYNAGSPRVNAAVKKAGSTQWELVRKYLPEETQAYPDKVLAKV